MSIVLELHETAMELADRALMARHKGYIDQAVALFREAFEKERNAASSIKDETVEPTRSVLLRSAASLALECGEFREAERLIAIGLSGNPPEEIARELRDLFEQVNFQRHLDIKGVTLAPNEFQLSISGNAVGYGVVQTDEYLDRVKKAEILIYRTAERKMQKPFSERISKSTREEFGLYITVPRAASFAVSFRLGQPTEQMTLPDVKLFSTEVIDDLLSCMELFNSNDKEELSQRIKDEDYFQNFVGMARQMAPDGDDIKTVGFTSSFGGHERKVQLTKTKSQDQIKAVRKETSIDRASEVVRVIGRLKFADSRSAKSGKISVIDDDGRNHIIIVPIGMMSDIVKPLYEERVMVEGLDKPKGILLDDITKVD